MCGVCFSRALRRGAAGPLRTSRSGRGARGFGVVPLAAAQRAGAARALCGPLHRAGAQQRSATVLLLRDRLAPRGQILLAAVVSALLASSWDAASAPVGDIGVAQPNFVPAPAFALVKFQPVATLTRSS